MFLADPGASFAWHLVTRLGEALILLPAALVWALAMMGRPESRSPALGWIAWLGGAVMVTTASKLAFIGWGLGSSAIDFTGVSGHAMCAAAIYPLLFGMLARGAGPRGRAFALGAGVLLALLVGVSRVMVGAHSVSEVVAGLALGGSVSLAASAVMRLPRRPIAPAMMVAVAVWLVLMPAHAPSYGTHAAVTRLALWLSGRDHPYTRSDLKTKRPEPSRLQGRSSESSLQTATMEIPVVAGGGSKTTRQALRRPGLVRSANSSSCTSCCREDGSANGPTCDPRRG